MRRKTIVLLAVGLAAVAYLLFLIRPRFQQRTDPAPAGHAPVGDAPIAHPEATIAAPAWR